MKLIISLAVLGVVLGLSHAHTYHLGECPSVEPQSDFNMKQFLGLWYVIQKTSTSSKCLIYNITQGDEPSQYRIEQTNPIPGVGKPYHYTGELSVPIPSVPAKMTAKFPLNVAGSADYTVFLTDYSTYAGIFTCQKLPLSHRHSATILSRTKSLDKIYIEKLRSRLSNAGVNPFDLSLVSHDDCTGAVDPEAGVHINPETFSSHNIGQAVKKVGSSIGDGVESLSDGAKKLYTKLTGGDEKERDREELDVRVLGGGGRPVTTEQYSEWLP